MIKHLKGKFMNLGFFLACYPHWIHNTWLFFSDARINPLGKNRKWIFAAVFPLDIYFLDL